MNLLKLLTTSGVPEALHAQAITCFFGLWQGPDHCKNAYIKEFERKNYPDEYRTGAPTFESRRAKP